MPDAPKVIVAIPAKNEAELLPLCLAALGRQKDIAAAPFEVVVACNNSTDGSADVARAMAAGLPYRLDIEEVTLPPEHAHAGGARRYVMDAAAARAAPGGLLLTTDADGIPDEDWVASTVAAFAGDIAAVAGRVSTDWTALQQFPADVLDIGAREWQYQLLSAELEARSDPEPHDRWPRHNQTCGANMAIRSDWYARIGGLPAIRTGEDGAMFDEVRRRDGRIRHDMTSHVTVSARLIGRAQGGMADALAARHGTQYLCDDLLEPADDLLRRNQWRHAARAAFRSATVGDWARGVGIAAPVAAQAAAQAYFGEAWEILEANVPQLAKHRLTAAQLDSETRRIERLLADCRSLATGAPDGR